MLFKKICICVIKLEMQIFYPSLIVLKRLRIQLMSYKSFHLEKAFQGNSPSEVYFIVVECFFQFLMWIYHLCVRRDFGLDLLEKRPK